MQTPNKNAWNRGRFAYSFTTDATGANPSPYNISPFRPASGASAGGLPDHSVDHYNLKRNKIIQFDRTYEDSYEKQRELARLEGKIEYELIRRFGRDNVKEMRFTLGLNKFNTI